MVFPILCLINKMSAGERREPLDVGTKQEMYLQTKERLQVIIQETKRKEERPEECPLIHTVAKGGVLLLMLY